MEDRHTLSEPRVKSTNSLVWLVDIHRKGVKDPIDTIEISEETLPPRKKKGKVVWRLPSDHSRLVSLASLLSCIFLDFRANLFDISCLKSLPYFPVAIISCR